MPRGTLTKSEMKLHILKIKNILQNDGNYYENSKDMANHYLNLLLDKLDEYSR